MKLKWKDDRTIQEYNLDNFTLYHYNLNNTRGIINLKTKISFRPISTVS